jgi:hypothetical protein
MTRLLLIPLLVAACSGKSKNETIGETHEVDGVADAGPGTAPEDMVDAAPPPIDAGPPPPPVTFQLKNTGKADLVFTNWKGWGPLVFAFSGKPPKAVPIILFPKHCTASCDEADKCPVCPEPANDTERKKQEAAAPKQTLASGEQFDLAWDGKVYAYEKTTQGKRKCECWRKVDPAPDTYTLRACGTRAAPAVGKPSTSSCVDQPLVLPVANPPVTLPVDFAK